MVMTVQHGYFERLTSDGPLYGLIVPDWIYFVDHTDSSPILPGMHMYTST